MGTHAIVKDLGMSKLGWWDTDPCKGMDGKIFFPEIARGYQEKDPYKEAKKICAFCKSRNECFELAMEAEVHEIVRFGVFGGRTPRERLAIQRLRNKGIESE